MNCSIESTREDDRSASGASILAPRPRRKLNDIWARVTEQEMMLEMTSQMDHVQVDSENWVKIERGPESYYIQKNAFPNVRPKRTRNRGHAKAKKRKIQSITHYLEDGEVSESSESNSDSSISSGGVSDDAMALLRKRIMPKSTTKTNAKRKRKPRKIDEFAYSLEESLDDIILRMSNELKESNLDLLRNVIEAVGIPAAGKTLRKVLKIEKFGGLMVKDGTRRRTPGGVFFYLIQRHPSTKSERLSQILRASSKKPGKEKRKTCTQMS